MASKFIIIMNCESLRKGASEMAHMMKLVMWQVRTVWIRLSRITNETHEDGKH